MLRFAPRVSRRLLAAVERLDNGKMTAAELNRLIGAEAERLGLPRPSYQRVRVLMLESRRHKRLRGPTTGEVLVDVAFRARPIDAALDHLSGVGVPKLDP
jgi:hypothetical protein